MRSEGLFQIWIAFPLLPSPSNEVEQDVHVLIPLQCWTDIAVFPPPCAIQRQRISGLCPKYHHQWNRKCTMAVSKILWLVLAE